MFKSKLISALFSKSSSQRKLGTPAKAVRTPFESLEGRQLFSVLSLNGTAGDDVINISEKSGKIVVNLNGKTTNYSMAGVTQITVNAGDGNDQVITDPGVYMPELVSGGNGNDTLVGGSGNDSIDGDAGSDNISGGAGNDKLYGTNAPLNYQSIVGIPTNTLLQSNKSVGVIHKSTVTGPTPVGPMLVSKSVATFGSVPTARYVGPTFVAPILVKPIVVVQPSPVTKPISNLVETDTIHGNDGDDTIYGGQGFNFVYGDAGNDTIYGTGNHYNELHGGDGNDTINGSNGSSTTIIYGDAGNDRLFARGTGANTVNGGDGNDQLFAGPSQTTLNGDAGDDVLVSIGGSQRDIVTGGDGLDEFWVDSASTEQITDVNLIEGLAGTVHRVGSFANGASISRNGQNLSDPNSSRLYNNKDTDGALYGTTYYPDSHNFSDHALFSSAGPSENDIVQGQAGDCYLMSALSGAAKNDPLAIHKSVVDLGDGTYAVQFWKNGQAQFFRVDADLPVFKGSSSPYYAQFGAEGSMWVPIMEKAFAEFRSSVDSYQSIWNGSDEGLKALNAQQEQSITGSNSVDLLNKIQAALSADKTVIAGTPNAKPTNGCPAINDHMYLVDHVNFQMMNLPYLGNVKVPVSITLRNPWGYDGAGSDSNTNDGYVTATASQFAGYFNYFDAALV